MTTIRPVSAPAGAGAWTVTSASAVAAALADDSDASYIRKTNNPAASIVLSFGTFAIGSSQRVKQARLRVRCKTDGTDSKLAAQLGVVATTDAGTAAVYGPALIIAGVHASATFAGPYYALAPDGGAWDQDRVDALRVQLTDYRADSSRAFIYEAYIDADLATEPSASITSPSGSVTDTSLPDVAWSYADPDGDGQAYYEVKIYTAAQLADPAFDPLTTVPFWTSGEVASAEQSLAVGDYLPAGTYTAYVRVAKPVNGTPFWSDFDDATFVLALAPPPLPTLTATVALELGRIELTAIGAAPTGFDDQVFQIQRSDDGGATWQWVTSARSLVPDAAYQAYVDDYEAPRGVALQYRVRAVGTDTSPAGVIGTAWSTPVATTMPLDGKWWVKPIGRPSLNHGGARILAGLDEETVEEVGVFRPMGRRGAVVVAGTLGGEDGTYRVIASGDAEWALVWGWAALQTVLLVQDPGGGQKYIRVIRRSRTTTGATSALRRELALEYVEVDT